MHEEEGADSGLSEEWDGGCRVTLGKDFLLGDVGPFLSLP